MKKYLYIAIAAAALTSCSQDEVMEVAKGEAISFGTFVENSSRAADPSYSTTQGKGTTLTQFNVYGTVNDVNIFNGNSVTKGNAGYGSAWTQADNKLQYWIPGANYKFVGIVDGNKENVTATTTNSTTGMPETISYTADGATDLLCATVVRENNTNYEVVPFTFTHLLSKINFTVTNKSAAADGYSFVVGNIQFAGNVTGTYNVEKAEWKTDGFTTGSTIVGNQRTVDGTTVKDIVVATKATSNELGTEVLFLPGTYAITFTVDILYNGTVITTNDYPAEGTTYSYTLAQNTAYNFNIEVSVGNPIQFTATTMSDWVNGNTADSNNDKVNDYVPVVPVANN